MATSMRRGNRTVPAAKEPLTVAAGPYGQPFHPILVTIPIDQAEGYQAAA